MYKEDEIAINSPEGYENTKHFRDIKAEKHQLENAILHCGSLLGTLTTPKSGRLEFNFIDEAFIAKLRATKEELQSKLEDLEFLHIKQKDIPQTLLVIRLISNILNFDVYSQLSRYPQHIEKAMDIDAERIFNGKRAIFEKYEAASSLGAKIDMQFETRKIDGLSARAIPIGLPKGKRSKSSELGDILQGWCKAISGNKSWYVIENRFPNIVEKRFKFQY